MFTERNLIILTITCRYRRICTFSKSGFIVQIYFKRAKNLGLERRGLKTRRLTFFIIENNFRDANQSLQFALKKRVSSRQHGLSQQVPNIHSRRFPSSHACLHF